MAPNTNYSSPISNTTQIEYIDDLVGDEIIDDLIESNDQPKDTFGSVKRVTKNTVTVSGEKNPEIRDPKTIQRSTFHPSYPFGKDKTGVADVDELVEYLQKLDLILETVETNQERYKRIQNDLPEGVFVSKDPRNLRSEESTPKKVNPQKIFKYCEKNKVKKIQQYLDLGISVNYQDNDTGNSPLITASVFGQKEAIFFLVEKGAIVNFQNKNGDTALHELVKNRRDNLAMFLIKHGADIFLENKRTFTPYDLALPWFQRDMKKAASGVDISQNCNYAFLLSFFS